MRTFSANSQSLNTFLQTHSVPDFILIERKRKIGKMLFIPFRISHCIDLHDDITWETSVSNLTQSLKEFGNCGLKSFTPVRQIWPTASLLTKLTPTPHSFVKKKKKLITGFRENPTNGFVTPTRSPKDRRTHVVSTYDLIC